MAKIIGCIGTSHVPTIGVAYDKGKQEDPAWKPLFDGYKPVAKWLEDNKADALVFIYNDHATTFFFDMYPTFTLPQCRRGRGLAQFAAHSGQCRFAGAYCRIAGER